MENSSGVQRANRPLGSAAARGLAAVVFFTTLLQSLSEPLAAWAAPQVWPRAGTLSQAAFLSILVGGLAVQALAVSLAVRAPIGGLALAFGTYVALVVGLDSPVWLSAANLAIAVALFFVAFDGRHLRTVLLVAGVLILFGVGQWWWITRASGAPVAQWWPYMLHITMLFAPLVVTGALGGALWGSGSRKIATARLEAEVARRRDEQRIAAAREAERERIAQEIHDVAAQHLAGLLSLADAALDLAAEEPATAVGLIADVRTEGRFAAASIYGALGELRAGTGGNATATPDALAVPDLVDQWRARGMTVELDVRGDLSALPAVVSVTAYRTVQEALVNAAKHAPGAAVQVRLSSGVERLMVTVENSAPAKAGTASAEGFSLGWGLSGLRNRVSFLNGTLSAGSTPEGGWRVSADLRVGQSSAVELAAPWTP